jgi:type II secretory pathway component PulL
VQGNLISQNTITNKQWSDETLFAEIYAACNEAPINLLQGEFAQRSTVMPHKKLGVLAGIIIAAGLGCWLASDIVSYLILQQKSHTLNTAINTIYKENFPAASSIVSPKERMLKKLDSLSNASSPALVWLTDIGNSLKTISGIKILNLDYHNNIMTVAINLFIHLHNKV